MVSSSSHANQTNNEDQVSGTSPLPSALKDHTGIQEVQNVDGEDSQDDDQEEGEFDMLDLKRNYLVHDISLAQQDLQYLDEARKAQCLPSKTSSPKENPVSGYPSGEARCTKAPFLPRAVHGRGGRIPFRGGRGGRAPFGTKAWSQVVKEGDAEDEGMNPAHQVFEKISKRNWASSLTNMSPIGDLELFEIKDPNHPEASRAADEEGWVTVGKGKEIVSGKAVGVPSLEMPSSSNLVVYEVIEQGWGKHAQVNLEKIQGELKEPIEDQVPNTLSSEGEQVLTPIIITNVQEETTEVLVGQPLDTEKVWEDSHGPKIPTAQPPVGEGSQEVLKTPNVSDHEILWSWISDHFRGAALAVCAAVLLAEG
ncbi:hypothetical protein U1Q18_014088 [Sarracenia purpurea var. burkii]